MPIVTAIALYFVIWWLSLFVVLPWGIKGQHEAGDVVSGTEPGAPVAARMKRKIIQNTILAGIIWLIIFLIVQFDLVTLDNIPFLPNFVPDKI